MDLKYKNHSELTEQEKAIHRTAKALAHKLFEIFDTEICDAVNAHIRSESGITSNLANSLVVNTVAMFVHPVLDHLELRANGKRPRYKEFLKTLVKILEKLKSMESH